MPLSDDRVLSLLERFFIPVYVSNEDYRDGGAAPPEEKAELRRIHREGLAAGLSVGTVHAFALAPDGRLLDSLHVADAFRVERLLAMLEGVIGKLGTKPGLPLLKPAPQSRPPEPGGALLLHLTARYLEKRGEEYALIEDAGGNWSAFPGEDWIALDAAEQAKLLPPPAVRPGLSWEATPDALARLYARFYPPTENNDLSMDRLEEASLRGEVDEVSGGRARARLQGSLRLKHSFYHRDDGNYAVARVYGTVEFEPARRRILRLRLVTDEATYGSPTSRQAYGVAVRSVP